MSDFNWKDVLIKEGIVKIECPFSRGTLDKWNKILDPHFEKLKNEDRSYATIEDMYQMGIFEEFFTDEMRSVLGKIMPDPVLLCFHTYEIKGQNETNHVFGEAFNGWHRDVAKLPGLKNEDPNFVSLFIYLSDVKEGDGEFEIIQRSFEENTKGGEDSLKVLGGVGTTFIWNRTLLHRASPNLSPSRRRVFKMSFQHNYLQNEHVFSESFNRVREKVTDPYLQFILGKHHQSSPIGHTAPYTNSVVAKYIPLLNNSYVAIRTSEFVKGLWWFIRRNKRPFGP